jgi:hypothetical protein
MYGTGGRYWRRRLVLVEFVASAIGIVAIGVALFHTASSPHVAALGVCCIGVGANYVPLALHAISLSPRGALETELAREDAHPELRGYAGKQLWLVIPFLLVVLAIRQYAVSERA